MILCIRNSDLAYEKRRCNHNIYKICCVTVLSYHLFYTFSWLYLTSPLIIYHHSKFYGKTSGSWGNYKDFYHFWIFGCITFLSFQLFVFKAQYLLLKSSNKFRIFTVKILHHLFILNKDLTFQISNRNKSDNKKVTDYRNVHNLADVFWTCLFVVLKLTRIWWILIWALKSLKNLHFDWSLLCKVCNLWPKKVLRSYLSWQ